MQARFVETAAICDAFISEAVRVDRCHFYLGLLLHVPVPGDRTQPPPHIVVPFQHLRPPLADLRVVYNHVRELVARTPHQERAAVDARRATDA